MRSPHPWLTHRLISALMPALIIPATAQAAARTTPSRALIQVVVLELGIPVSKGAGLFVSADGKLVTSYDLIKPTLEQPGFSLEFESAQGGKLGKYQVGLCNAERLCLLKLPLKPSQWLAPSPRPPRAAEKLRALGHTEQNSFIVSPITATPPAAGARSFAFQGADATLLGTSIVSSGDELLGIQVAPGVAASAFSIQDLLKKYSGAEDPSSYLDRYLGGKKAAAAALRTKYADPAIAKIKRFEALSGLKGFKPVVFGSTEIYTGFIPETFGDCKEASSSEISCTDAVNGATFTVKESTVSENYLLGLNGKTPQEPTPLPIVIALQQRGKWPQIEASLGDTRRKLLFSIPGPLRCEDNRRVSTKFPMNSGVHCSQSIHNDGQPGAVRFISYVQLGRRLFEYSAWSSSVALEEYFSSVPTIYQASIQQTGFRK